MFELGGDFTFVGRQRRLRVGDAWYRVDLLFFHRRLRCLVVIDLKLGEFTHADAGKMHPQKVPIFCLGVQRRPFNDRAVSRRANNVSSPKLNPPPHQQR